MKLLFGLIISVAILAIVVALYCSFRLSDRKNTCDDKFFKEQLCPKCKTGKYTYELDSKSDACPNISCLENGKCSFYEPLKKSSDTDK